VVALGAGGLAVGVLVLVVYVIGTTSIRRQLVDPAVLPVVLSGSAADTPRDWSCVLEIGFDSLGNPIVEAGGDNDWRRYLGERAAEMISSKVEIGGRRFRILDEPVLLRAHGGLPAKPILDVIEGLEEHSMRNLWLAARGRDMQPRYISVVLPMRMIELPVPDAWRIEVRGDSDHVVFQNGDDTWDEIGPTLESRFVHGGRRVEVAVSGALNWSSIVEIAAAMERSGIDWRLVRID
jgi:hypothetical protein